MTQEASPALKANTTQTHAKVWDIPTRLFHWSLLGVFVFQFVTGDILDDAMQLHFYGGYVALGLILFRIIWGFVGSYHARFSSFIYSPSTALQYLMGRPKLQQYLGHNPLGAYSVLAILAVMLTQAVSGLFMTDDIFLDGPYHGAFDGALDDAMNWLHHNAISLMWGLIVLHLSAIAFYSFKKKQRLVPAMLHGKKPVSHSQTSDTPADLNVVTHWWRFLIVVAVVAVFVYCLVNVFAPEPEMGLYDY
ncbi:cytochrome b/b6 domain-containing protein [Ningiella sp. W23]|uniref:cytochrome b/b6 domain-containing protein n=1 Tax=Ningiella sp. W23 TaxID=3023715 RepID=UPI0037563830